MREIPLSFSRFQKVLHREETIGKFGEITRHPGPENHRFNFYYRLLDFLLLVQRNTPLPRKTLANTARNFSWFIEPIIVGSDPAWL